MKTGHEVVEDYSHVGLTLRQHPVSFVRADRWSQTDRDMCRSDEFAHGNGAPDPREQPRAVVPARDIFVPDLLIDRLKVKGRNFHQGLAGRTFELVQELETAKRIDR